MPPVGGSFGTLLYKEVVECTLLYVIFMVFGRCALALTLVMNARWLCCTQVRRHHLYPSQRQATPVALSRCLFLAVVLLFQVTFTALRLPKPLLSRQPMLARSCYSAS